MRRLSYSVLAALTLGAAACAVNMGGSRNIDVTAVAVRAAPNASPHAVAAALVDADADVALVTGPADSTWLATVADRAALTLSGPAMVGDRTMGFLAGEPVGDTTVTLAWDGGRIEVQDALYQMAKERLLDLMMFRLADAATARPAIRALTEYMATDVDNSAAVIIAVEVPSAAAGDSVARMLSPAYFDALRCEPGLSSPSEQGGVRLFYGPEARLYCTGASADEAGVGEVVRANLVMGRRR